MDTDGDICWGPTGRKTVVHVRMQNDREKVLETLLGSRGSNPSQEGTARLAPLLGQGLGQWQMTRVGSVPAAKASSGTSFGMQKPHKASSHEINGRMKPQPTSSSPATWEQKILGEHGSMKGVLEHAYLTYRPFQIDSNEVLSVPHFL